MKKLEIVKAVSIALAEVGIVAFWILGFKGLTTAASYALIASGCLCWVALIAILIDHIRSRRFIIV